MFAARGILMLYIYLPEFSSAVFFVEIQRSIQVC